MSPSDARDGLRTYDPIDLQQQLMEQEDAVTRAIHALEVAVSMLRRIHIRDEHHRTAAELRAVTTIALNAILEVSAFAGRYELAAHMTAISRACSATDLSAQTMVESTKNGAQY